VSRSGPFGVYVHIPFCARRCDYCAFATWTDRHHLADDYLLAVETDLRREVAEGMDGATSVFFGGGTPSLVPAAALARVVEAIPRVEGAEVTVECNPETVTASLLRTYRAAGVNRLSFGVQSLVPSVLASLGREHDPASVYRAVALARDEGFVSFNLDLIYGAAGESIDDWRRTIDGALDLEPPHISAYGLTVEPGTPLADDPARHPDDDDQATKYLLAHEAFVEAGLVWYEISNWAQPGHECRHNLLYWMQGDYRGFGCAAHSHRAGRRWWNVRTPERYMALVQAGLSTEAGSEGLDAEARRLADLQLSLRTASGVPEGSFSDEDLDQLGDLLEEQGGRYVLTRKGRLLANEVALRLR
jgi:putative oxygen-independent coproporphyrinogen III oxidase